LAKQKSERNHQGRYYFGEGEKIFGDPTTEIK
jgi:hypothetical protein